MVGYTAFPQAWGPGSRWWDLDPYAWAWWQDGMRLEGLMGRGWVWEGCGLSWPDCDRFYFLKMTMCMCLSHSTCCSCNVTDISSAQSWGLCSHPLILARGLWLSRLGHENDGASTWISLSKLPFCKESQAIKNSHMYVVQPIALASLSQQSMSTATPVTILAPSLQVPHQTLWSR